jgi:hypothetical protein
MPDSIHSRQQPRASNSGGRCFKAVLATAGFANLEAKPDVRLLNLSNVGDHQVSTDKAVPCMLPCFFLLTIDQLPKAGLPKGLLKAPRLKLLFFSFSIFIVSYELVNHALRVSASGFHNSKSGIHEHGYDIFKISCKTSSMA